MICRQFSTKDTKYFEFAVAVVLSLLSSAAMFAVIGLIEWGALQADWRISLWPALFMVVFIWGGGGATSASYATHRIFGRCNSSPIFWGCFLGTIAPYVTLFALVSQGPFYLIGMFRLLLFAAIPFVGAAAVGAHLGSRDCRGNRTGD